MENVTDTLFGTKYFTHGAEMQLPRKVPLRIEPKSYFGEHSRSRVVHAWQLVATFVGAPEYFFEGKKQSGLSAANERTFLSWMHMAITMGGITTALASFSVESENEARHAGTGPVTKRTTQAIVLMLLPISIGMIAYALFTFFWRSRCMERKQVSFIACTTSNLLLASAIFLAEPLTFTPGQQNMLLGSRLRCWVINALTYSLLLQMGFFNDVIGPVVLCALIVLSLATIMMMSIVDFFR